jgi:flagellar motor switch protein FliM
MDAPEVITPEQSQALETSAGPVSVSAKPVDFRHPMFLSSAEWRKLRMEVEEFVEATGALLSTYLRLDFGLQLGKLHTRTFGEFAAALPSPTHVILFKTDPLRGICLAEVRSGIAQAVVDRLLGGPGKPSAPERSLTDMETALMDQFVQLVLQEWCKMWGKVQKLDGEILGHENNPKFLQCTSGDTMMLVLHLDARLDETEGPIQLAFPFNSLEPLMNKLAQLGAPSAPQAAPVAPTNSKWTQHLDTVSVQMNIQWPAVKMSTRSLIGLEVGAMLDLKAEDAEHLELRMGKTVKFRGRLGTRNQKWAVQITEVCKL